MKSPSLLFLILVVSLLSISLVSAVWWNPFTWFDNWTFGDSDVPIPTKSDFGTLEDNGFKIEYPEEATGRTFYSDRIEYDIIKAVITDCSGKEYALRMVYNESLNKDKGKIVIGNPENNQLALDFKQNGSIDKTLGKDSTKYYYSITKEEYVEEYKDMSECNKKPEYCDDRPNIKVNRIRWINWTPIKPKEFDKIVDTKCRTKDLIEHTTNVSDCGTIASPGWYELNTSISTAGDCININATDVYFNQSGYNITNTNGNPYSILDMAGNNITIDGGGGSISTAVGSVIDFETCNGCGAIVVFDNFGTVDQNQVTSETAADDGARLNVTNIASWRLERSDSATQWGLGDYYDGYLDLVENVTFTSTGRYVNAIRNNGVFGDGSYTRNVRNVVMTVQNTNNGDIRLFTASDYVNASNLTVQIIDTYSGNAGFVNGRYIRIGSFSSVLDSRIITSDGVSETYGFEMYGTGGKLINSWCSYTGTTNYGHTCLRISGNANYVENFSSITTGSTLDDKLDYGLEIPGGVSNVINNSLFYMKGTHTAREGSACYLSGYTSNNKLYNVNCSSLGDYAGLWLVTSNGNKFSDSYIYSKTGYEIDRTDNGGSADYLINVTLQDGWTDISVTDGELYKQWWVQAYANFTNLDVGVPDASVTAVALNETYSIDQSLGLTQANGYTKIKAFTQDYINSSGTYVAYFDVQVAHSSGFGILRNFNISGNGMFTIPISFGIAPVYDIECAGAYNSTGYVVLNIMDSNLNFLSGGTLPVTLNYSNGSSVTSGIMTDTGKNYQFNTSLVGLPSGTYVFNIGQGGSSTMGYACSFSISEGGGTITTTDGEVYVWIILLIIFFGLFITGIMWRSYILTFFSGAEMLLMGIWIFRDGLISHTTSEFWIYPLAWILTGLGVYISLMSALSMIEQSEGGDEE